MSGAASDAAIQTMARSPWNEAVAASADPERAGHYLALLRDTPAAAALRRASADQARVLCVLLSGSQASSELLLRCPEWIDLVLNLEMLRFPRGARGMQREVSGWLGPLLGRLQFAAAFAQLRLFKQRETLRIATRDLAGLATLPEIARELSDLADVCLEAVLALCRRQMVERCGQPWHLDAEDRWTPSQFCVLGMGKLGGQELNYSSDVDVLFVYSEEGAVFRETPRPGSSASRGLSSHQYFKRLSEAFVEEVGRLGAEGSLYRVDVRLRPEAPSGPLARSLPSYESYYAQWGQTWERMMLMKARGVAGDAELAHEFVETVQSFRHPRSLSERSLREIAAMKQRLETEVVKAGEIERNVKLGRGGIREIEFVVQALQLLHAGRQPFLADPQTLSALPKLVRYRLLRGADAEGLVEAYQFLRTTEHRLQMDNHLQTHTIPTERAPRERLAALMGCATLREFESRLDRHRDQVRRVYETILDLPAPPAPLPLPLEFDEREEAWRRLLAAHSFRDPEKAFRLCRAWAHGPGFGHVSPRTVELGGALLGRLLAMCPRRDLPAEARPQPGPDGDPRARWLSDPDRVLARLDTFLAAYGARSLLFESWTRKPALFELLVLLIDRSEFLAESAIRTPDLLDDLEQSGLLGQSKTAAQILDDLRAGLGEEDEKRWLRRYHQAEFTRIGLRDILGLADFEQNHVELSALADACLQFGLEIVLRRLRLADAPVAVIGLGKLGGLELNYGSDLDVVLVTDGPAGDLPALQRVAVGLMDLLSSASESGVAFALDTRLRPDGEKGLLVNCLEAYEDYYRHRARLWELQAMSRSRFIAGNAGLGARFQAVMSVLTDFGAPQAAAAQPGWQEEIARMRRRIQLERTPVGKDALAIKTGVGGLMDAEFVAQRFCLERGWHEPNTLRALERAREAGVLEDADAGLLIENYRRLRRIEAILRRWSYAGETELPDDPAPMYRVAVRCGFADAAAFAAAVARYRRQLRAVYEKVFGAALPARSAF